VIKKCTKHGQTKHFLRKDGSFRCGKCASEWVINHRRRKKEKLIELFGGACTVCGYKKYAGTLDFHHINPGTKAFALSVKGLSYSWKDILQEAKKCILVCKNCHTEIEAGITALNKNI
jgi:5-methylcytosine-specific restriction endonuclease McrA